MKKALVAAAVALGFPLAAEAAEGTDIRSSANPSYAGQSVTFTATFVASCADGVSNAKFTIDGRAYKPVISGAHTFTATVTVSSLGVGRHPVSFEWSTSTPPDGPTCGGKDTLTQTVLARPSPKPKPAPSTAPPASSPIPTPTPLPQESPSASPVASTARSTPVGNADGAGGSDTALAIALYLVLAGLGLAAARRI